MQVAFLTPTLPWPANTGGTMRTYYLLKALAGRHTVDLFSFHYGASPAPGALATVCRQVTSLSLGSTYHRHNQLRDLLRIQPRAVSYFVTPTGKTALQEALQPPYDLIICDEVMMTPYLEVISRQQAGSATEPPALLIRPKVDHLHYAEMAAERPWGVAKVLDQLDAQRFRRYEKQVLRHFAHAIVCSQDDYGATRSQSGTIPLDIIPNGADIAYFQPKRAPDPQPTLLLLGTMHYYPNIDAVRYFFDTVHATLRKRIPDLQVFIVGHQPPAEIQAYAALPGVTVTGSVDDVRTYMARSWAMAVPLRLGGGTRLKITEALAAGLPVVSTTIGAQGLDVVDGKDILLADTSEQFADAVEKLLTTPALAQQLSQAGRTLVETNYSWQALGARFTAICEQIVHS